MRYGWDWERIQNTPAPVLAWLREEDLARDIAEGFDWTLCRLDLGGYPECPPAMDPLSPVCQACVSTLQQRREDAASG